MEQYNDYKEKQQKLHAKIFKNSGDNEKLKKGYGLLNVIKGNDVILNSQNEAEVAFDFNLYEKIHNNKSLVEIYMENFSGEDETEKLLLKAMVNNYASLFRIKTVNKEENSLELEDILNSNEKITIVDKKMSENCTTDYIIFTRVIKLEEFNITSDSIMIFNAKHENYLLRVSKKNSKKILVENEWVKRYISFFQLYKDNAIAIAKTT